MGRPDTITQLQADARIYGRCPTCDNAFPVTSSGGHEAAARCDVSRLPVRRILGVCPCCGRIFRLTDLMIAYRAKPSVTWLDRLEAGEERQQRAEDKFAEDERQIRGWRRSGRQALPSLLCEAEPVSPAAATARTT
jgi:uncharacterized C2H2 Zn-finger protein